MYISSDSVYAMDFAYLCCSRQRNSFAVGQQGSGLFISIMNNVIFLDIDGVLNTKASWKNPFSLDKSCIRFFCDFVNSCNKNPKIILTSSWKTGFSEKDAKKIKWNVNR